MLATSRFNSPRSSRNAPRLESIFVDALMTLSLPSSRELLPPRCGGPWLKPLGSGRFGKYSCLRFDFVRPAGRSISSEAGTPSARGLSNFRYLFLRARGCPSGSGPRICAEFGFVGRDIENHGDRLRTAKTHAQKKRCPVAIGFFSSRHRRCSCGRNVQRRSPSRIACKADGSRNGTDSRWVDFNDQEPRRRESWNTSITV
jgi:hypothetical protein